MKQASTSNEGVRLLNVATANPGKKYTQQDLLSLFSVTDRKVSSLFTNSHIFTRNLCLPESEEIDGIPNETSLDLWKKNLIQSLASGKIAIEKVLRLTKIKPINIEYIACVTSTGFLCPGLTAYFTKEFGFNSNIHRIDLVGMGCNGGLNGMQPLINYCNQKMNSYSLLVCIEICSAAYVFDMTMRTSVVNSLFGDGCAAAIFSSQPRSNSTIKPVILGFESHIIPEKIDSMRFDYDGSKFSFFLDRDIPYVIGNNVKQPIFRLLERFGLKIRDIKHWLIHSGGRKVLDAIKYNLNISDYDIRHTVSVLRDFGNLSSGSFLFSYERLMEEKVVKPDDYLLMMTMGPGATIECCLARF